MYFGRKIKEHREKAGLSVAEAAKKLKVSEEKILDWESGTLPTETEMHDISSAYEILEGCYKFENFYEAVKKGKYRLQDLPLDDIFTSDIRSFITRMERYSLSSYEANILGLLDYYGEKLPYEFVEKQGIFRVQHAISELSRKVPIVIKTDILNYLKKNPDEVGCAFCVIQLDCKDFVNIFQHFIVNKEKDEDFSFKDYIKTAVNILRFIEEESVKESEDLEDFNPGLYFGTKTIDGYTSEVKWDIKTDYKAMFDDIIKFYNEYVSFDFEEFKDPVYREPWDKFEEELDYKARTGKFKGNNIPVEPKKKGTIHARLTDKGREFLLWYETCISEPYSDKPWHRD